MKINNFRHLVHEVAEFFIRYDAFDYNTDCDLYLVVDNGNNGHLIINPSNSEGLEFLHTYNPGGSDFTEVEEELGMLWEDIPVATRYDYLRNNMQGYLDEAEFLLEASMVENPDVDYSWYNPA